MDKMKAYALKRLAAREYGVAELRRKLKEKFEEFSSDIEPLLDELKEKGYLSDERFLEDFIKHQRAVTKAGPRMVVMKLMKKGFSKEKAMEWVSRFFTRPEQQESIERIIDARYRTIDRKYGDESVYFRSQKLKQYLISKGFCIDVVLKSVDNYYAERKD